MQRWWGGTKVERRQGGVVTEGERDRGEAVKS